MVVDRGMDHGIHAGNPIITNNGVAGLVTVASKHAAKAMLLLDRRGGHLARPPNTRPSERIEEVAVCALSGKQATEACPRTRTVRGHRRDSSGLCFRPLRPPSR